MRVSTVALGLAHCAIYAVLPGWRDVTVLAEEVTPSTMLPSSPTPSSLRGCAGSPASIGDGSCDGDNNNKACGFDGGDCCPCTCEDGDNPCGINGFHCQDPTGPSACNAPEIFSASFSNFTSYNESEYPECHDVIGYIPYIGDGFCDDQNNNEECAYDGGDCCWCTCLEEEYTCGIIGFDCLDPTVSSDCVDVSFNFPNSSGASSSLSSSEVAYLNCTSRGGNPDFLGDGLCDEANNNGDCEYDGGDCCACTCADGLYSCGAGAFDCIDPDLPSDCANATSSTTSTQTSYYDSYDDDQYPGCYDAGGWSYYVGDGFCQSYNNIEECAYDGGDCCPCTCKANWNYECGFYDYYCIDPTVPEACAATFNESNYADDYDYNYNPTDDELVAAYPNCTGIYSYISDGWCDSENNNEDCGFDGGDCCECTCVDSYYSCGIVGFDCDDPTVPHNCSGSSSMTEYYSDANPNCSYAGGHVPWIGDGFCDRQNNIEECAYDAGDCCPCTCSDGYHSCGEHGYECEDPDVPDSCGTTTTTSSSSTIEITATTPPPDRGSIECMGDVETIGNGACNVENNNAYCKFDGGDCCECTCVDSDGSACSGGWYDCQDPDVSCGTRLRTAGVAILSGAGVLVLTLCCLLVPRSNVAKRMCNYSRNSMRPDETPSPPQPAVSVGNQDTSR